MKRRTRLMSALEYEWRQAGLAVFLIKIDDRNKLFLGRLGDYVFLRMADGYLMFGELPLDVELELAVTCRGEFHKFQGIHYHFPLAALPAVKDTIRKFLLDVETPEKTETFLGMVNSGYFQKIEGGWTCE